MTTWLRGWMKRRSAGARRRLALAVALCVAVFVPRTMADRLQVREYDPDWTAPPEAAARANPLANWPETVAGGQKLFHQRCASCHLENARGGSRAPDLTQSVVQAQSDGVLFWKITSGNTREGMPTFSFLPELQRWQLVQHLRITRRRRQEADSAVLAVGCGRPQPQRSDRTSRCDCDWRTQQRRLERHDPAISG